MENTLLNLVPASYLPEVHLSQYDVGRELKFTLKDGSSDYTVPSGAVVTVKATKPSGLGFVVNAVADGNVVTLSNTETMTNENGRFPAELSITQGSTVIGTSNFIFNIERSPHPQGTIDGDAESLLPELTLLVERIEAAADSVDEDTQTVTEAKAEVLQAKADTLQAKADALTARDDTLQAKADTITAKESAEASAQAAAESAQEAEDTLSEYAKVDGYYEEMAVGSAEQLLSSQFVEDSVPYKFRTSGGSADIGSREYDEIVGGSIVWNQLVEFYNNIADRDGISTTYDTSTHLFCIENLSRTTNYSNGSTQNTFSSVKPITNHKYLILTEAEGGVGVIVMNDEWIVNNPNSARIFSVTGDATDFRLRVNVQYDFANAHPIGDKYYFHLNLFDLTLMFGSTIADYIYSLEQAQSGKGVAFFKSLFPNDYYPYNAGELLSVEGLQSHDTVEFNQWDEEWELGAILGSNGQNTSASDIIRSKNFYSCLPNTEYYVLAPSYINIFYYDSNKAYISYETKRNTTITTPSNARYFKISTTNAYGTTYKNDICINLSWSGWRNGEYEPYKKHSYALDSSLTLRGIPKLDANNNLYYDGDVYEADGTVTREWAEYTIQSADITLDDGGGYTNVVCARIQNLPDMLRSNSKRAIHSIYGHSETLWPFDSTANIGKLANNPAEAAFWFVFAIGTTVEQMKSALAGTTIVYELATPTEETAEPYISPQAVDDFGTEKYISGNVVPVGHNTQYPANLRDKLQHLPNLADNDGYYMISQQNKQMSLELFRIPKAPTTDGTYTLKATVSGGTPTYIWEAVE